VIHHVPTAGLTPASAVVTTCLRLEIHMPALWLVAEDVKRSLHCTSTIYYLSLVLLLVHCIALHHACLVTVQISSSALLYHLRAIFNIRRATSSWYNTIYSSTYVCRNWHFLLGVPRSVSPNS
jgi:hypothetical protein